MDEKDFLKKEAFTKTEMSSIIKATLTRKGDVP